MEMKIIKGRVEFLEHENKRLNKEHENMRMKYERWGGRQKEVRRQRLGMSTLLPVFVLLSLLWLVPCMSRSLLSLVLGVCNEIMVRNVCVQWHCLLLMNNKDILLCVFNEYYWMVCVCVQMKKCKWK